MAFSTTSAAGTGAGSAPGGDYHTTSEIDVTEVSGSHVLTINGYSRAKRLPSNEFISSSFTFAGSSWSIRFYPNSYSTTYDDATDYVSIYLTAGAPDVMAQFPISLLGKTSAVTNYMTPFIRMSDQRGFQRFVKTERFEQSGCIKDDDSFKIICNITILKVIKHEYAIATNAAKAVVDVPPSDLVQHLGNFLSSGDGADVMFEVGGETLRAHRSILAARSPVFKAELFSPMREGTATCLWINDMEPRVFRALLDFIYTDVFPEIVEEDETMVMVQHLLVAADRYGMERLKLMCEEKLCGYIDIGTAGDILALAEQRGCDGLKKKCLDFLLSGNNLTAAIVTGGFEHLTNSCPTILKELLAKLIVTSSS